MVMLQRPFTSANLVPGLCGLPDVKRNRRLMLVATEYQWFIDDSGSSASQPVFVLAGFLSTVERWAEFSNEWQAALDLPPKLEYFKASEAMGLAADGQFAQWRGWNKKLCVERVNLLADIIRKYAKARISVSMRHDDFNQHLRSIPAGGSRSLSTDYPFAMIANMLVVKARLFALDLKLDGPCDFIFDEQGQFGKDFADKWEVIADLLRKEGRGKHAAFLGSAPIFRDEKQFLPLQAADLYAWLVRRQSSAMDTIYGEQLSLPPGPLLRKFRRIPSEVESMRESRILSLKASIEEFGQNLLKFIPNQTRVPFSKDKAEQKRARRLNAPKKN
jgi:hypothetical protein